LVFAAAATNAFGQRKQKINVWLNMVMVRRWKIIIKKILHTEKRRRKKNFCANI